MKYRIVQALHTKYLGQIAEAKANTEIYLENGSKIQAYLYELKKKN